MLTHLIVLTALPALTFSTPVSGTVSGTVSGIIAPGVVPAGDGSPRCAAAGVAAAVATRFSSVAATPRIVNQGGRTRLSARLARSGGTEAGQPVSDTPVTLWARRKGTKAWAAVATVNTDARGIAALDNVPPYGRDYQWRHPGSPCTAGATSVTVAVGVRPVVTTKVTPALIKLGQSVAVYGAVRLADPGQPVYLQQLITIRGTSKWVHRAGARLTKNRAFRFPIKPASRGVHHYRVARPADTDHLLALGKPVTFRAT